MAVPELRAIHLLASKDADFCCGKQEVVACATRLGVAAHLPEPFEAYSNSGVVRLRDVDGVECVSFLALRQAVRQRFGSGKPTSIAPDPLSVGS